MINTVWPAAASSYGSVTPWSAQLFEYRRFDDTETRSPAVHALAVIGRRRADLSLPFEHQTRSTVIHRSFHLLAHFFASDAPRPSWSGAPGKTTRTAKLTRYAQNRASTTVCPSAYGGGQGPARARSSAAVPISLLPVGVRGTFIGVKRNHRGLSVRSQRRINIPSRSIAVRTCAIANGGVSDDPCPEARVRVACM